MRILQVHNRYREPGGEDTVVAAEAELLRAAGHEVVQYQVENPSGWLESAGELALAAWNPVAGRRVRMLADRVRPDVAHVHNTWFALSPSVLRALQQAGVPVVMTLHNYRLFCANAILFRNGEPCELCVGSHPWDGARYRCYRGSAVASLTAAAVMAVNRPSGTWQRHVDLFLSLTEFARKLFIRGGLPEDRVIVKPNSVADPGPRANPPSASRSVLFVGRLSEDKGVLQLLDAWQRASVGGLELVVVGDGPLRQQIEERATAGVRVVGRLASRQVAELMLASRALAFPSRWYEGQPMVVLEALAAGLPVLASNHGGTEATLRGMGPEWLVEAGDRAAWQLGLTRLSDGSALDEASRRARTMYEEGFTPERSLAGLESAYRHALARSAGR
jgi:glycosyltransferase involved in cell wall biosynthesis